MVLSHGSRGFSSSRWATSAANDSGISTCSAWSDASWANVKLSPKDRELFKKLGG